VAGAFALMAEHTLDGRAVEIRCRRDSFPLAEVLVMLGIPFVFVAACRAVDALSARDRRCSTSPPLMKAQAV